MPAVARQLRPLPAAPARLHDWPRPWGDQRPAVFHRVRSSGYRAAIKTRARAWFGIRFICTTIRYITQSPNCTRGTDFVNTTGADGLHHNLSGSDFFL